ncbi:unnamed protein product [Owenia fusiformis]|uniref:Uncharacterized protein n=1 Tax=Owenia fusiformis TaxID=6347 RepID=A0A8J1XM30_OWEFU|nr:unnamed protein product [Owenia fusiformis]
MPSLKHIILITDDVLKGAIDFNDLLKETSDEKKSGILLRNANISMDDAVWIGLTSGSTGKPKYCPMPNRVIIHMARCFGLRTAHSKGTIMFNDRPMSWAGGAVSFAFALANEYTIVTIDVKQTVKNSGPETILQLIRDEKVNIALLMPYLMYDVINMETEERKKYSISSLKVILTGGQRIDPVLIESVKTILGVGVTIGYGMTEGGGITCMFPHADFTKQHLTVGYGVAHVEISIRDKDNKIVPIDTQGEICTRGPNIFHGYFNDEEKTREVIDQYGWLHTGDIGTLTKYGYVTIVGRLKEFIKRGTVIVRPSKIENILVEHPSIHQVQVVGVPDPRLFEELCACIKVKDGQMLTEAEIKEWCAEVFGDFTADGLNSAPRYFLMLDEIPTLMNGKIDRNGLKKLATEKFGQ